jgi:hypothetical protein
MPTIGDWYVNPTAKFEKNTQDPVAYRMRQIAELLSSLGSSLVDGGPFADTPAMTRTLGLTMLLVSLLIVGALFIQQMQTSGPSAPAVTHAETQAQGAVGATNLQGMASALQAWYATNGTYAGATLPSGSGVALVHADATSYCLETIGSATGTMHEIGPYGIPQPGAC